jgi:hypothetical protein
MPGQNTQPFATSGFSFDPNISPNSQAFSLAVMAVNYRNPPAQGTSFVTLVVTGTATINDLQVGTATIGSLLATSFSITGTATINDLQVGTATIALLQVGTATISQLIAPVTITGGTGTTVLTLVGTGSGNAVGTALTASINGTTVFLVTGGTSTTGAPTALVIRGYGPTAAGLVDMTADSGTFTGTLSGLTVAVTGAFIWSRNGNQVTLWCSGAVTGSSTSTSMTILGLPTAIQPARTQMQPTFVENSGALVAGFAEVVASSSTIILGVGASANGFTASGVKGLANASISYLLN